MPRISHHVLNVRGDAGAPAKAVFGHGGTGQLPPFLQMLTKLGKIGSLLFSLFLRFS